MVTPKGRAREGVYLHGSELRHKAMGYCLWHHVREGFFAPMLEVVADRHQRIATMNDQWCQPPTSVRIQALWVGACKGCDLPLNSSVALAWCARMEANPISAPQHFTMRPKPLRHGTVARPAGGTLVLGTFAWLKAGNRHDGAIYGAH